MAIKLQTTTYNVIYVLERDSMPGQLKVGKTNVEAYDVKDLLPNCEAMQNAVRDRYKEAATLGITDLHVVYTEVAHFFSSDGKALMFDDHAVHDVLQKSHYPKAEIKTEFGEPGEWFLVDLEHVKQAIAAVKEERQYIEGPKIEKSDKPNIIFRDEQQQAISETIDHFSLEGDKMLWNAKMRFGKTLCALELINQMAFKRVLILTHRPTVRSGWFEDFELIRFKCPFQYGAKGDKDLKTLQRDLQEKDIHYIYFASMQDLRGKQHGSDDWKENNELVFKTDWDLIILDEAHEGTQTALGQSVITDLCKKRQPKMLYLSGTPYNILSQFEEKEIYTWDYVMEQEAKERWNKECPGEKNPYEGLAQLHIYSYSLGEVFERNPEYTKSEDDYFNFAEFFRTWTGNEKSDGKPMPDNVTVGQFIHEKDVIAFLDLLCCEEPVSYYPFSNEPFRQALSHTLWMLPGVAAANRLAELILQHKLHTVHGYHVVSVAGEGLAIEEANDDADKIEKKEKDALKRVKDAIKENKRTITLSCGRLTTGVSVPEWTGVLMLSGGYSTGAANYMQTIFRGQTPYKNGAIKQNCYAFDFAPDRTLTVVDDFIHQQPRSRNTKNNTSSPERIASTLRHLAVVAMVGGREEEYDAKTFISDVNHAYADHVISHGFKSRKLFKNLATFTEKEHELLNSIEKIIGGAKYAVKGDGTVVVAKNDMTDKGGGKSKTKKKDPKKPKAKAPKSPKDKEREQIRHSQMVLDYIFVRLPLMLFGSATDTVGLTIDELLADNFIDDESWREFMPPNFTKELFLKIAPLVRMDVLIASTDGIIKQTQEADSLGIEERTRRIADILANFSYPDKETVLTPWRVVNMHMTDTIGGYDFYDEQHNTLLDKPRLVDHGDVTRNVLATPNTHILEINSKSGVYPLWLAYSLWRMQHHEGMSVNTNSKRGQQ